MKTMKLGIGLLFCVLLSSDVMILLAEETPVPSVIINISTIPLDIRVGGTVILQCDVTGTNLLQGAGFIVEWRRPLKTLVWNGTSYENKYMIRSLTQEPKVGVISQHLTISPISLSDTDVYICNLKVFKPDGGSIIYASDNVSLTIPYFPDSSPVCSPNGPFIVTLGEHVHLSCTSELGYPPITILVMQNSINVTRMFVAMETDDIVSRQYDVTVNNSDDGTSFICSITSPHHFSWMQRSCTIGPFTLYPGLSTSHNKPTMNPASPLPQLEGSQTVTIVGLASSIVVLAFLLTTCVLISVRVGNSHPDNANETSSAFNGQEELGPSTSECQVLDFEIYNPLEWPRRAREVHYVIPESHYENADDIPIYSVSE